MVSVQNKMLCQQDPGASRVLLVRCAPARAEMVLAREMTGEVSGPVSLVFFHGAGVEHARDARVCSAWQDHVGDGCIPLVVCETAWQRRFDQAPPAGWQTGSLVQFWHQALMAERVDCYGEGC